MRPNQLLRLYPRHWRRRYGDEFLALLESTPITRAVIVDVLRGAALQRMDTGFGRILLSSLLAAVTFGITRWAAATLPIHEWGHLRLGGYWFLLTSPLPAAFVLPYLRLVPWFRNQIVSNLAIQSTLVCALTVFSLCRDIAFELEAFGSVGWGWIVLGCWAPIGLLLSTSLNIDWRRRSKHNDDLAYRTAHPPFF